MVARANGVRLLAMVLAFLCLTVTAFADTANRIELVDGKIYENVEYTVDNVYKTITFKTGDWKRTVSFTDVAVIIDEVGDDITEEVLGSYYQPSGGKVSTSISEVGRTSDNGEFKSASSLRKEKPFEVAFRFGGNYSFPLGTYYDGVSSGIGYGFDAIIPITKEIALRGTFSKSGMNVTAEEWRDMFLREFGIDIGILPDGALDWTARRYIIAVQWYNWPHWKSVGKTYYYFYSGVGIISHTMSGDLVDETLLMDPTADFNDSKFIMPGGGGLVTMVSENIGLEFGLAYDMVFVGSSGYTNSMQYAFTFDLKAGVIFMLGRSPRK